MRALSHARSLSTRPVARSGVRAVLVTVIAVVALATTACSNDGSDPDATTTRPDADPAVTSPGDGTDGTSQVGDPTLGPDIVRIEGTVTSGRANAAADGEVAGPFTMRVPSRGGGNGAVINPVSIDGETGSVVWDGGRPLTLEGPALSFDGEWIFDGGSLAFDLASGVVALAPGSYSLVGPVAVGHPSGLATPADSVSFVSGADSAILGTGQSTIQASGSTVLLGPGSFDLFGSFTVTTADGVASAGTITVADRSFEITVSASPDGTVRVSGLAEGAGWT